LKHFASTTSAAGKKPINRNDVTKAEMSEMTLGRRMSRAYSMQALWARQNVHHISLDILRIKWQKGIFRNEM